MGGARLDGALQGSASSAYVRAEAAQRWRSVQVMGVMDDGAGWWCALAGVAVCPPPSVHGCARVARQLARRHAPHQSGLLTDRLAACPLMNSPSLHLWP